MKKLFLIFCGIFCGMIFASETFVNVMDYGAKGDGEADDLKAVQRAVRTLHERKGGELHFPTGIYRIGAKARAAVFIDALSGVRITFASGAVLLMDNLEPDGKGGGHGIVVRAPGSDICLENVHVKWAKKPSGRSSGDAFRFEGFPSDEKTLSRIYMTNCTGENSAQTGAVFMGCSDIFVNHFSPVNTWADGLHFNACRRVNVNGVRGIGNGDDTLAFVTYYAKKFEGKTGTVFSFPELNEWCNSNSNAVNIISENGHANGMRISGGIGINVANISVSGKWAGIQLDSARKTTENRSVGWGYHASRNISVVNVSIRNCEMGLIVRSLNILPDAPEKEWKFDVGFSNLRISGVKKLGIDIQSVAGINLNQVSCDSPVRLRNLRGIVTISNMVQQEADFQIVGVQGKRVFGFEPNMELKTIEAATPGELEPGELRINNLYLRNASLEIDRFAGIDFDNCRFDGMVKVKTSRLVDFGTSRFRVMPEIQNSETINLKRDESK